MARPPLIIAGIEIPLTSMLDYDEQISPVSGGSHTRRTGAGAAKKITWWRRWSVRLSGGGWIPAPLAAIDFTGPVVIDLALPIALATGQAIPAGMASRPDPWGVVARPDGVGGEVRFLYPRLTVVTAGPQLVNGHSASPSWTLECEQA